ncbi:MAG: iron ABC transporter permease [Mobiluncus sp.]|uniref:ABC transporter permease n=1 Tax=Mobiluncus sp. TaxID=47293 RepID=UPI00258829C6|nr:iron ABC transporter permease [Mobiluncus sp.]MCI6584348.1 iron ABC transporter permease [Mobiluncus sp.]
MKSEKTVPRILLALAVAVPLGFWGLFFLLPTVKLIWLGISGGVLPGSLSFGEAWREILGRGRTWSVLFWTLAMGLAGTMFSVVLGVAGAWVLYGLRLPGRRVFRALLGVPFVLPSVVVGVAFQNLLAASGPLGFLGLEGTRTAIVLGMVFFNFSLVARVVGNAWVRLDPRVVWAARVLGATPARAFLTVTLPRLLPSILAAGSLVFLYCITSYGLVRVLGGVKVTTLEVEIYLETAAYLNLPGAAVLSIIQILIVLVALGINSLARARFERTAGELREVAPRAIGREDWVALVLFGFGFLLVVVPLAGLVVASLRRGGEWTLDNFAALGRPGLVASLPGTALEAAGYSLLVGLISTLITLAMGLSVAVVLSRRVHSPLWRRTQEFLDVLMASPQGVSAVTVGFGMLITLQAPPFSMSANAFFLGGVASIVALPLVLRSVLPTMRAIRPRMLDAAATLGASPLRVFWTLEFPVLFRVSGVGAGFAFAIALGEFGATSFLARPLSPTLPVAIFALSSKPEIVAQGASSAASVLLAGLCALAMFLAESVSGGVSLRHLGQATSGYAALRRQVPTRWLLSSKVDGSERSQRSLRVGFPGARSLRVRPLWCNERSECNQKGLTPRRSDQIFKESTNG